MSAEVDFSEGPVWVLGMMSGTSLDGVDAAMLLTDGETLVRHGPTTFVAYEPEEREVIRAAFGWGEAEEAEQVVTSVHIRAAGQLAMRGAAAPALVGFHGQTLAHDPAGARTRQIGDAARLAEALGAPVVSDFRSADMAAGGQGAPLAPFFHFALARWAELEAPTAFFNLGGVGNVTLVDPAQPAPESPGALTAFDTGPANAPVNDFVASRTGAAFDRDGALAAAGRADAGVLAALAADPYFARMPPKSLDRGAFDCAVAAVADLSTEDGAATLTALAAAGAAAALAHLDPRPDRWLLCGGGRRNAALRRAIQTAVGVHCPPIEAIRPDIRHDGDFTEAWAFAFLAARVARGLPTSAPGTTGCAAPTSGGRITG